MKKLVIIMLVALGASSLALSAQSLKDNPDYQKSLELKAQAQEAFDSGDYDGAADLAAQAKEYALRSDAYVDKMVQKARADSAIAAAKDKLAWADGVKAKDRYPKEYGEASDYYEAALGSYQGEDYPTATDKARAAVATLDNLASLIAAADAKKKDSWPAVYVVRLIPERRDCLWRIAEYPFIYNNPLKWTVIYEANKKTFRDPGNPNLIFPGQKLTIPAIRGENREGTYDPSKQYKPFPNKELAAS